MRCSRSGEIEHLGPHFAIRETKFIFVRRIARWDKMYLIEAELFTTLLSQQQVSEMDRIEGPAINAASHRRLYSFNFR